MANTYLTLMNNVAIKKMVLHAEKFIIAIAGMCFLLVYRYIP